MWEVISGIGRLQPDDVAEAASLTVLLKPTFNQVAPLMPTTLVAHEQAISRIFSNDYVFTIPPFQRPYAWTAEEAEELFDDLLEFTNSKPGTVEEMPPYFLGSIVLIKSETTPDAQVIDGQQRLTTLTLLLSAIRANVAEKDASDITLLIYEKGSQILGTHDRFRLSLRERDKDFFQRYAQRENGFLQLLESAIAATDSQRNIQENARLFDKRLKAVDETDRLRLAQFIVTRCYLVVVATPDLNSAYRIFSVLNTRGLDLTATDLLKAQIIGAMPESLRQAYTNKWETTEEDLGRGAFGELFGHIRMIYRKAKPKGTLLEEFRESVLQAMAPQYFVDSVLTPLALVFEELTDQAYESTEKAEIVNEYLKWLNRLEFSDWIPPALAYAVRHRQNPTLMAQFFRDLERLAYYMLLVRAGINERIERFALLTKIVEAGGDVFLEGSPLQLASKEQQAAYRVLEGELYENLSPRACSLVLLRLDSLLSGGGATYDYGTISVEHVLPQTPDDGSRWLDWFPDPRERDQCVHCLGNLVLLTRKKNSSASNYEFDKKKNSYFTRGGVSPFVLTTQILPYPEWLPSIVRKRQADLLALLGDHWRLKVIGSLAEEANLGVTWRDEVVVALRALGGSAPLGRLYDQVRQQRSAAKRSMPPTLEAIVRKTLEEHSSDSSVFRGGADLFRMTKKRTGVWTLKAS